MKDIPSQTELMRVCNLLNCSPLEITRTKESFWKEEGIDPHTLQKEDLIQKLRQFPKGINRPIVIKDNSVAIVGRPPENVLQIL